MSSTLSNCMSEHVLSLVTLQHKRASSSVQGRISWVAWNCGRSLGFLLSCVSTWGTRSCLLREGSSPLALRGAPWDSLRTAAGLNRASSGVETETSQLLSISDMYLRVSADLEQGRKSSPCVEARKFACLSSCSWGVRPLIEFYLEPAAFFVGCKQGVSAPSCCHFILGVTFKEVPGHGDLY